MKITIALLACVLLLLQFSLINKTVKSMNPPYHAPSFTPLKKIKYQVLGTTIEREKIVLEEMPEMYSAFQCESKYQHYRQDGSVKRSHRNSDGTYDYGWTQINTVHEPEAEAMGFKLWTMTPEQAWKLTKKIMKYSGPSAWTCYQG